MISRQFAHAPILLAWVVAGTAAQCVVRRYRERMLMRFVGDEFVGPVAYTAQHAKYCRARQYASQSGATQVEVCPFTHTLSITEFLPGGTMRYKQLFRDGGTKWYRVWAMDRTLLVDLEYDKAGNARDLLVRDPPDRDTLASHQPTGRINFS